MGDTEKQDEQGERTTLTRATADFVITDDNIKRVWVDAKIYLGNREVRRGGREGDENAKVVFDSPVEVPMDAPLSACLYHTGNSLWIQAQNRWRPASKKSEGYVSPFDKHEKGVLFTLPPFTGKMREYTQGIDKQAREVARIANRLNLTLEQVAKILEEHAGKQE